MARLLFKLITVCQWSAAYSQACWDGTAAKIVTSQIASPEDDVEAPLNNDTYLYERSSDLELGYDDDSSSSVVEEGATRHYGPQYTFMRFTDVAVPSKAQVRTAKVIFSVKSHGSCCNEDFDVTMKMQKSSDAPAFTSPLGAVWNESSTAAELTYTPPQDAASSGGDYVEGSVAVTRDTPDLTGMVQEVVDLTGWSSGNSMAVMIGGATSTVAPQSREYWAYSRRRASGPPESWAPKLEITYCPPDVDTENIGTTEKTGITPTSSAATFGGFAFLAVSLLMSTVQSLVQ